MPLQAIKFKPGIDRSSTSLANEGGWYDGDKIRFRLGYPEKIGGWVKDNGAAGSGSTPPSGSFWGVCRSLWNWISLAGRNYLSLGTNLKLYVQDSADGDLYNVTPIRLTTTNTATFAATSGSSVITVTDAGHGAQTGDFVLFSGALTLGGSVIADVLNQEFEITYIDSNSYTITVSVPANGADTGNGGGAVTAQYEITGGNEYYATAAGFGAGYWGGTFTGTATNALNGALNDSDTTITVNSTTGFTSTGTIIIDSELITYTGKTTTPSPEEFTGCTRGALGTTAAAHSSGATVTQVTSAWTGWGLSAAIGVGVQLRLWSQINYGEYLMCNPRGGAIYMWVPSAAPSTFYRAQILSSSNTNTQDGTAYWTTDSSCPTVCNIVHISDQSRFTIAFGCNDYGSAILNPLLVRWSDQEDYATWAPSATNQAGSFTLSSGSEIIAVTSQRQEILVFTDAAVYSMQYLGPPYVWGFQQLGSNVSVAGPKAVITASNTTFWMGEDKFYVYDGRVQTLPCTVWQYVFNNINRDQHYQIHAATNEGFDEVWWFYCSAGSTSIDRYVVFNYSEKAWYYGTLARTAWLDTPLRQTPTAAGYDGQLFYHEQGVDDGSTNPPTAINSYIQSSDFDIGDGYQYSFAWKMLPDFKFDGSTVAAPSVNITLRPRQNPGSNYGTSEGGNVISANSYVTTRQYNVQQFTQELNIRVRGRQMAFRVESDAAGTQWQLGVPRIDVKPDGRR